MRIVLVIAFAVLAACAPRTATRNAEQANVQVENQRFSDVNVYVLNGGQRIRLGRVGPKRTAQFRIPTGVVPRAREVEFLAESLSGGGQAVSQRIWIAPGETVRLVLSP